MPAKYSRNATVQRAPYVSMKNMLRICAMKSSPPTSTNTSAIALDTQVATTGSPVVPEPCLSMRVTLGTGRTLSRASACRVLGATSSEPRADDSAAAPSPM